MGQSFMEVSNYIQEKITNNFKKLLTNTQD